MFQPPPQIQTLQVVVLADPGLEQRPAYRHQIGDGIDSLSDLFRLRFGIRLNLLRIDRWRLQSNDTMPALLVQLAKTHPVPDADLVIGWTAHPVARRAQMSDRVYSQYSRRYMVIRHLGQLFPNHQTRQRLAELDALAYGVSRIFGAIGTCAPFVMSARPRSSWTNHPPRWQPINVKLMRAHATLDLRTNSAPPKDMIERASRLLIKYEKKAACPSAMVIKNQLAMLKHLVAPPHQEPKAQPPGQTSPKQTQRDHARLETGLAALKEGDEARALTICRPLAQKKPASGAAFCAAQAAEALGNAPLAIQYYRAHLAFIPRHLKSLARLSRLVGRTGDDDAARALLEKAVELDPTDIELRINLGVAYARLGRYDDARRHWQHALSIEPTHADASKLLQQLPRVD